MLIPKEYIENIITIVEWNLKEYHSPELPKDDFVIKWEKIVDLLTSKNLEVIDEKFLYYLNYAIQTAKNYVDECGVSENDVNKLFDWIMPLYLNKTKQQIKTSP